MAAGLGKTFESLNMLRDRWGKFPSLIGLAPIEIRTELQTPRKHLGFRQKPHSLRRCVKNGLERLLLGFATDARPQRGQGSREPARLVGV